MLSDLQGRRNDSFTLPGGRTITSGVLLDATYEIVLTHRSAVRDFCLVQEGPNSVRLELVVGPELGAGCECLAAANDSSVVRPAGGVPRGHQARVYQDDFREAQSDHQPD